MTSTAVTEFVAVALSFAFAETRWIGIVGIVPLAFVFPLSQLIAVGITAAAVCAFHFF